MEDSNQSLGVGSWLVIVGLASGAWLSLPDGQDDSSAAADRHLTANIKASEEASASRSPDEHSRFPFDEAPNAVTSRSVQLPATTKSLRTEEIAFSADPDAERVADNDSIPDDVDDVDLSANPGNDLAHADDSIPPEVDFARAIARLNVAPTPQQVELLDKVWALGLDLRQELAALTVIEPLAATNDALLATRAAEAADSLLAALSTPRDSSISDTSLDAETDAYVMDLNARATADPDSLARRNAITELASHSHPGAVNALAAATMDVDPENRVRAISSLLRLADSGYQQARIVALLENMAAENSPEIATYAHDALKSLRKSGRFGQETS